MKTANGRTAAILSRLPLKYVIPPLVVMAFIASFAAVNIPDDILHVSFLDVGEGDAILIQDGGQNILIDGGPSPQSLFLALGQKMPFWDRSLDLVILTHPHLDHLSGLVEALKRYQIGQIITTALSSDSPVYQEWLDTIKDKNIACSVAVSGQEIDLAQGTKMAVLSAPADATTIPTDDFDENSLILKLSRQNIGFLFMADAGQETEDRLLFRRADLSCTVLKVGHHGSSTSTTSEFLAVARPQAALISVGADNTFGHPDLEVLDRLKASVGAEEKLYRTDRDGTVEFITDGKTLKLKIQRQPE